MKNEMFLKLAEELMDTYEKAYNLCAPQVEKIINFGIKDINLIEQTLDQALDIYTDKGFYLFIKLLIYYSTVDNDKAQSYLEILKEDRCEEYDEFVKKYKKTK